MKRIQSTCPAEAQQECDKRVDATNDSLQAEIARFEVKRQSATIVSTPAKMVPEDTLVASDYGSVTDFDEVITGRVEPEPIEELEEGPFGRAKQLCANAHRGDTRSQYTLAMNLQYGLEHFKPDAVEAYKWMALSTQGLSEPDSEASQTMKERLASSMTPTQHSEAERLVAEWKPVQDLEFIDSRWHLDHVADVCAKDGLGY